MDSALVLALVSLAVSIILVIVVVFLLRRDRKAESDPVDAATPALTEAERISEEIGPLLIQVEALKDVVVEGRGQYEARIKQLQHELSEARKQGNIK